MTNLPRQLIAAFAMCLLWLLCFGCSVSPIQTATKHNVTILWDGSKAPTKIYVNNTFITTVTNTTCTIPLQTGDEVFVETIGVTQKSNTITIQ